MGRIEGLANLATRSFFMPVVVCPRSTCGQKLTITEAMLGRSVSCPRCRQVILLPTITPATGDQALTVPVWAAGATPTPASVRDGLGLGLCESARLLSEEMGLLWSRNDRVPVELLVCEHPNLACE